MTISRLTQGLRTGVDSDTAFGAVMPAMHLSSTFSFAGLGEPRTYDYTRSGNPTRDLLGEALATFEGGAGAVVTSSGISAITLVASSLVSPGQAIVIPHDCYGGTWRLFHRLAERGRWQVRVVDFNDADAVDAVLAERPALVWLETPSNPLLRITDIAPIAKRAHVSGAVVAVDNTFCTPLVQRPLELGADVVVHSTTKYLNGHSDVVGGAVVARDDAQAGHFAEWGNILGVTGAPFDAWLTLRGLRTLQVRMDAHQRNALAVVDLLGDHHAVRAVHHPSLTTHPGHEIAARQQDGFGAMVSFDLRGGRPAVERFVAGLHCFTLAESLGGTESLVAHPATMTHASMSAEARAQAGIGDGLVRLSVGIEPITDLLADLRAGLDRAGAA